MHAYKALLRNIFLLLWACGAGACLFFSLPVHDLGWLAWIGFVPLFLILFTSSSAVSFLSAYACGMVFFIGVYGWILDVPGYNYYHHTILAIFLGLYFALFGLAFVFIRARLGKVAACWAAPFLWVLLEFLRSNLFFLSLPWPLLGHSQYRYLPFIQNASVTGVYGVSFMLVLFNVTISLLILRALTVVGFWGNRKTSIRLHKGTIITLVCTFVIVSIVYVFGVSVIKTQIKGKPIKIAVAQGNIDRGKKWDPKYAASVMQVYADLTRLGAKTGPDLIVWPEAATPRSVALDRNMYQYVEELTRETGVPILLGSTHVQKIKAKKIEGANFRNSVFLIDAMDPEESPRHDKIRLMPFGEYVPAQKYIPWSYIKIPEQGNITPGDTFTLFQVKDAEFGVTICWENIFPDLARKFVHQGAQFMVNVTNEGWFGPTAPYQFLASSVFRSVENRVYFVRSANIGISCFIDPYGRIVDRVRDNQGKDIYVRGILVGSVIPMHANTIYTRYGDFFAIFCVVVGVAFLMVAAVAGVVAKRSQKSI